VTTKNVYVNQSEALVKQKILALSIKIFYCDQYHHQRDENIGY